MTISEASERNLLERETGFEPATPSLEGSCSSQLSYSRPRNSRGTRSVDSNVWKRAGRLVLGPPVLRGGEGRIRTSEGVSQQIYSLPRLAASVPLQLAGCDRSTSGWSEMSARNMTPSALRSRLVPCFGTTRADRSRCRRRTFVFESTLPSRRCQAGSERAIRWNWIGSRAAQSERPPLWSWRGDSNP